MKDALAWLRDHGGGGGFSRQSHQTPFPAGGKKPLLRPARDQLDAIGAVEFYGNRRCRIAGGNA